MAEAGQLALEDAAVLRAVGRTGTDRPGDLRQKCEAANLVALRLVAQGVAGRAVFEHHGVRIGPTPNLGRADGAEETGREGAVAAPVGLAGQTPRQSFAVTAELGMGRAAGLLLDGAGALYPVVEPVLPAGAEVAPEFEFRVDRVEVEKRHGVSFARPAAARGSRGEEGKGAPSRRRGRLRA